MLGGQRHAPAAIPLPNRPGARCTGGWMGPRAGLMGVKNLALRGFDPRTVQAVAKSMGTTEILHTEFNKDTNRADW